MTKIIINVIYAARNRVIISPLGKCAFSLMIATPIVIVLVMMIEFIVLWTTGGTIFPGKTK